MVWIMIITVLAGNSVAVTSPPVTFATQAECSAAAAVLPKKTNTASVTVEYTAVCVRGSTK